MLRKAGLYIFKVILILIDYYSDSYNMRIEDYMKETQNTLFTLEIIFW